MNVGKQNSWVKMVFVQNRRDFIVLYYVIYSVANYIINK
jgi:hypothetical protein